MADKLYSKKKVDLGKKGSFSIKEGAMTAAAKREGVSNSQYEQEHKGDSGTRKARATGTDDEGLEALMDELTAERKAELASTARLKMQAMEREYWRVRNGKAKAMKCPYCEGSNIEDCGTLCCALFAKAFQAIMDRQDEVDIAAKHARTINTLGHMVGRPN